MANRAIRIDEYVLDAWKEAVGVPFDDRAAAIAAIRYATKALLREKQEVAAKPDGEAPDR